MLLSFGQGSLRRAVLRHPASSIFPMALRHGVPCRQHLLDGSPPRPCQSALASWQVSSSATAPQQVSSCFPMLLQRRILVPGHPAERSGNFSAQTSASLHPSRSAPASNSSATAPRPATNLIRRRRSPVWLAIWRTWAGFANSQLLRAAFCSIYLYRCAHSPSYHIELLLRQTQICRPICTDCLRHLRISAG